MARIPSYVDDVERQFGPFRGHPAVTLARKLRETHGITFDACMSMAVHLTDANTLEERISLDPRPPSLDSLWTPEDARAFLRELRKFAAESRFPEFLAAHRELYQMAEDRKNQLLDNEGHLEWFPEFFGDRTGSRFTLALGLLNGPCNYGPRFGCQTARRNSTASWAPGRRTPRASRPSGAASWRRSFTSSATRTPTRSSTATRPS